MRTASKLTLHCGSLTKTRLSMPLLHATLPAILRCTLGSAQQRMQQAIDTSSCGTGSCLPGWMALQLNMLHACGRGDMGRPGGAALQ